MKRSPATENKAFSAYMFAFALAGSVSLVLWIRSSGILARPDHLATVLMLGALVVVAEWHPIPSWKDGTEITASFTFAFALLLVAPPPVAIIVIGIAGLAPDLRDRKPPGRIAFNLGQLMFSVAFAAKAGYLVGDLQSLAEGGLADTRWLLAVLVTCASGYFLNALIIGGAIALLNRLPIVSVLRANISPNLGIDGLLLSLAPVFAVVGTQSVILVPLLLFTVWSIFKSTRLATTSQEDAFRDSLTGLPNRRMFETNALMMLESGPADRVTSALVVLDLNGFKGINDTYGHHAGDLVLQATAQRLEEGKRPDDLVARLGGDEFAIVIRSIHSREEARSVAQRFRSLISQPVTLDDGSVVEIGGSFGIALRNSDDDALATMLENADTAMYEAKSSGAGVVVFSDLAEGTSLATRRSSLVQAIAGREFQLLYQPIVSLVDHKIVGAEALLRWEHPSRGRLSPGIFMPEVALADMSHELTTEVLRIVSQQCLAQLSRASPVQIFLNVAAPDLVGLQFLRDVEAMLSREGIDGALLGVDLVEQDVVNDQANAIQVVKGLRELGVGISVDQFGAGVSSLPLLWELAPDRVKISRHIITGTRQPATVSIADAAVSLCQALGISTVAVGVESLEDLAHARRLGVSAVQGHIVAPALQLDDLIALIDDWAKSGSTLLGPIEMARQPRP